MPDELTTTAEHRLARLASNDLALLLAATPGWTPARFPGVCGSCGLPYAMGDPIRPASPSWAETSGRLPRPRSWWAACCWDRPVPGLRPGRQRPQPPVWADPAPAP